MSRTVPNIRAEIRNNLRAGIEKVARSQANHDLSQAFICYQVIQNIWSRENIEKTLNLVESTTAEITIIRNQLLRILSILTYINDHQRLDNFHTTFFTGEGSLICSDDSLPLSKDVAQERGLDWAFHEHQYLFIPAIIWDSNKVLHIDRSLRLPFESISRKVSAGAYGEVDRVSISSRHFRYENSSNDEPIIVACKRFTTSGHVLHLDSEREVDNLTALKKNISKHDHIRIHLAIILHGDEHLILFPWAVHSDLHVFLLGGRNSAKQEVYDFNLRFPSVEDRRLLSDICTQMKNIASALEWLHNRIEHPEARQNRIHLAHMDLKPDNILIDIDNGPSTIGKWVLTDFGISTLKEGSESNVMTIRDVVENFTINTSPQRNPGAYQPPEVQEMGNSSKGIAGRGGDIWSFGCIFAETIAFALGRAPAVKAFRKARKGHQTTDYFYEETRSYGISLTATAAYRVRSAAESWLRKLPYAYSFPNRGIDCCVDTLFDILKIHREQRPIAEELLKMMRHVAFHVDNAANGPQTFDNCPVYKDHVPVPHLPPIDIPHGLPNPNILPTEVPGSSMQLLKLPNIYVPTTTSIHSLSTIPISKPESHPPPSSTTLVPMRSQPFRQESNVLIPPPLPPSSPKALDITVGPQRSPLSGSANTCYPEPISAVQTENTSVTSHRLSRETRHELHGIMLDHDKPRSPGVSVVLAPAHLPQSSIVSVSLCRSSELVAYLVSGKSQYTVLFYAIDLINRRLELTQFLAPIPLPANVAWQHVVVAEAHVVVWGISRGRGGEKIVYMTDGRKCDTWSSSAKPWLANLMTVALSKNGFIAFVCSRLIFCTRAPLFQDSDNWRRFEASEDHWYTHAAFNDAGTLLYAWQFGRPDDRLYVWHALDSATLADPPDSEGSYSSSQRGDPNTVLIPYNSQYGCIVQGERGVFFPAQIRSTQRGSKFRLPKKTVTLPKVVASCVYGDHSFLYAEKGMFHTRIWECRIAGSTTHVIDVDDRKRVVELPGTVDKGALMRVAAIPGTEDLMILLCKGDGKVVVIPVEAEKKREVGTYHAGYYR